MGLLISHCASVRASAQQGNSSMANKPSHILIPLRKHRTERAAWRVRETRCWAESSTDPETGEPKYRLREQRLVKGVWESVRHDKWFDVLGAYFDSRGKLIWGGLNFDDKPATAERFIDRLGHILAWGSNSEIREIVENLATGLGGWGERDEEET